MTRPLLATFLAIMLLAVPAWAADTMEATTSDGRKVILYSDGTWKFSAKETVTPDDTSSKPAQAKAVLKSKKGFYELWYDANKWVVETNSLNPEAEFMLRHTTGDAYAMSIAERISMPIKTLLNVALQNAKNAAPDAKVLFKKDKTVNGVEVVNMQINGTIDGIPFTYFGYYWSGKSGSLQAITFTGQNLFSEYLTDFADLLNGLIITKPE